MKSYALGLLLLSSVNALGNECIINASDKSTYAIKSSIYSYSNDINTCKCQSGYELIYRDLCINSQPLKTQNNQP
jgi:hypothetical protein